MADANLSRDRWLQQKYRAADRGIPFLLTYEEWRAWWVDELAKRPGSFRGRRGLQMCRHGDTGPYSLDNIYAASMIENLADADVFDPERAGRRAAASAVWLKKNSWLRGTTGADHPQSRAITTPAGTFPSRTAAAEHYGISRTELRRRVAENRWP